MIMIQEDKELFLKDLCGRLPYGVIVNYKGLVRPLFSVSPTQHFQITLDNALDGEHNGLVYVSLDTDNADELKPYLRPMSSMTKEEQKELEKIIDGILGYKARNYFHSEDDYKWNTLYEAIDWLNAHHFDFRNLIEKGLAIAVTPENNPYK
jgi:hypothetical protein